MDYKKRIHIAPVGFEVDRIVIPAVDSKADKVYLLVHDNNKEDKAGKYIKDVIKQLKENNIESERVQVNWRDVESITKAARKLLKDLFGNEIFVNISSGSKNHAIALDRAIMTLEDQTGIREFYAESEKYEGFTPGKKQLSVGVRETKEVPKRKMIKPDRKAISALQILFNESIKLREEGKNICTFPCKQEHELEKGEHKWGYMRKNELANECIQQKIITVREGGNKITTLDKMIIQKLDGWDYIKIEKISHKNVNIGLTTLGMAFIYEMTP